MTRSDGNGGSSGDGLVVSLGADDRTADTHRHQPDTAIEDNSLSLRYDKHDDVCVRGAFDWPVPTFDSRPYHFLLYHPIFDWPILIFDCPYQYLNGPYYYI